MVSRLAIWCAVSSKAQASENKSSLTDQETAGREYAESINAQVVRVYRIPGHTRDLVFWEDAARSMPAYRQLREDVQGDTIDVLWALDPDRLGRNPSLSNTLLSLCMREGVRVHIDEGNYDIEPGEIGSRYIYAIQSTRAKEDQERRKRHHRQGMKARIMRGLPPSHWPYGLEPVYVQGEVTGGRYNESQIGGVKLATKLFLRGVGYIQIANELDEAGWKPDRSDSWRVKSVRKMLHNDIYAGYVSWGDVENPRPSNKFPRVWDDETHGKIIAEREERSRGGRPPATAISGIVVCARCGWHMAARRGGYDEVAYYACPKDINKARWGGCHTNYVKVGELYSAVEETIRAISDNTVLREVVKQSLPNRAALEQRVNGLRSEIDKIQSTRNRLTRLVAEGTVKPDAYRRSDAELLDELETLEGVLHKEEVKLYGMPDVNEYVERLQSLTKLVDTHWHHSDAVRRSLKRSGLRMYCENGSIVGLKFVLDEPAWGCRYIQDILATLHWS